MKIRPISFDVSVNQNDIRIDIHQLDKKITQLMIDSYQAEELAVELIHALSFQIEQYTNKGKGDK